MGKPRQESLDLWFLEKKKIYRYTKTEPKSKEVKK